MRICDFNEVPNKFYIDITLPYGWLPLNLLRIFRTPIRIRTALEGGFSNNRGY